MLRNFASSLLMKICFFKKKKNFSLALSHSVFRSFVRLRLWSIIMWYIYKRITESDDFSFSFLFSNNPRNTNIVNVMMLSVACFWLSVDSTSILFIAKFSSVWFHFVDFLLFYLFFFFWFTFCLTLFRHHLFSVTFDCVNFVQILCCNFIFFFF